MRVLINKMNKMINTKRGEGILELIIIVAMVWGIYSFFNKEDGPIIQDHPNYSSYEQSRDCSDLVPNNPYDEGSGHYAGFEWGEEGRTCGGNSTSFIEGCEDYENQEESYQACLRNN